MTALPSARAGIFALVVALVLPASLAVGVTTASPVGATDHATPGARSSLRPGSEPRSGAGSAAEAVGAGTGTGTGTGTLTFQSVGCERWSDVPGNVAVDPGLDDTAGRYVDWGPPVDGPVAPYAAGTLPAGCAFVEGVTVRISAVPFGEVLAPRSSRYTPLGHEDDVVTTLLGSTAGERGELAVATSALSPAQRASLVSGADGAGLWVAASLATPGPEFANLRCHRDAMNADDLEVIRLGPSERDATCVLFTAGAPPSSSAVPPAPVEPGGPVTPPLPSGSVPSGPVPSGPVVPVSPAPSPSVTPSPVVVVADPVPPDPVTPAPVVPPVVPPVVAVPPPVAPAPATVPSTPFVAAEPVSAGAVPVPVSVPVPSGGAVGVPAPPAADGEVPGVGGQVPVLGGSAPASTEAFPGLAPPPVASPTKVSLVVEVGGATREEGGASRSPWTRPLVVDLDCGALARRRVEVPIGRLPAYRATSDPVTLPTGSAATGCAVDVVDSGVDPGGPEQPVVLTVDGVPVVPGLPWRVSPSIGGDREVVVEVTFAAAPVAAVTAVGLPPLPTSPATAPGDQPVPGPVALALAGLFATGLAAALAQSWRRWLRS